MNCHESTDDLVSAASLGKGSHCRLRRSCRAHKPPVQPLESEISSMPHSIRCRLDLLQFCHSVLQRQQTGSGGKQGQSQIENAIPRSHVWLRANFRTNRCIILQSSIPAEVKTPFLIVAGTPTLERKKVSRNQPLGTGMQDTLNYTNHQPRTHVSYQAVGAPAEQGRVGWTIPSNCDSPLEVKESIEPDDSLVCT